MNKTSKHTSLPIDKEGIKKRFSSYLKYYLAKDQYSSTMQDVYIALSLAVRELMIDRWIETQQMYHINKVKRVYYLSMEYMIGRSLTNNMINLQIFQVAKEAMQDYGISLEQVIDQEEEAGLGNGGLGRLAACFIDSLATLHLPSIGYGLRYNYGIFKQEIQDNQQVETPDEWLRWGNPWEISIPHYTFPVKFGGRVESFQDKGQIKFAWIEDVTILGIPYDYPIVGYDSNNVNTLRLWSAKASEEFDFRDFDQGDYMAAVQHKVKAENITKVLYPNESTNQGKELRLQQQYFFASCSLQDIIRRFESDFQQNYELFPEKISIQLNDTHPAIGIAELMRIFVDEKEIPWEKAWEYTEKTFAYTNHTLLPEALERWNVSKFEKLLPRHMQIIYEINRRFLEKVSLRYPGNIEKLNKMSIIQEKPEKQIRMAYLSVIGSHSVNGVARLHSELVKTKMFKEFYQYTPEKFNSKTNGVSQRRWLLDANSLLASFITDHIGSAWIKDLYQLKQLEKYVDNVDFIKQFADIKRQNKQRLANVIKQTNGIEVNVDAIFDIHVKRIHEYKRQLMNILHVIMLYNRLKNNPEYDMPPRVFIFGGKAAPGYVMAKTIIHFINCVAQVINNDYTIKDKIKVVFIPNYSVTLAEKIIPAADVSEQISTAGFEASGTGNMKFALNGALTIGTLDGANIEIMEEVGSENIFIFGMNTKQVVERRKKYNPFKIYQDDPEIFLAIELIKKNFFSRHLPDIFQPIIDSLLYNHDPDHFMVIADLKSYSDCHSIINQAYENPIEWHKRALLNVARMGKFSSDNVISQYAEEIWNLKPEKISTK
ncbi:MAG: glycogen/starch/alpha-glucan phosphorylase [Planctomycetes bacterium]|nr:glycogen/starch/alpha-glucan phosphorylase [Planctomycetota bacterium]HPY74142.1 glycogen/starch/alpha-glucan phosphorylase [Planctomycetota bacterium]HQA99755.1 glycogen/starch/alpha-glucan phosphorylase [Planctomycetota bacterium]